MKRRSLPCVLSCALIVSGVVAGCAGETPGPTPQAQSPSPSASAVPTTLLSGREGKDGRVLAVKIDNTVNAHPQAGVMAADLVYVEEVEWGLTRLLTVYASEYPDEVGPVRSARITDLDLLAQFGRIAFAFSGSNPRLVPLIAASPLYDVSGDVSQRGYWREDGRSAPWDFFGDPAELLERAPKAVKATDVGFRFADRPPRGGRQVDSVTVRWPNSTEEFRWSKAGHRWLVWTDGERAMSEEGPQLGGTTVIVQQVEVYPSQFGDAYGGVTPMSETVGKGKALVLRNGRAYPVRWVRPSASKGTRWIYRGRDFAMAPGQIWILLLDDERRPDLS